MWMKFVVSPGAAVQHSSVVLRVHAENRRLLHRLQGTWQNCEYFTFILVPHEWDDHIVSPHSCADPRPPCDHHFVNPHFCSDPRPPLSSNVLPVIPYSWQGMSYPISVWCGSITWSPHCIFVFECLVPQLRMCMEKHLRPVCFWLP